LFDVIITVPF